MTVSLKDRLLAKALLGKNPVDWTIYEELDELSDELDDIYRKHKEALIRDIYELKAPYVRLRESLELRERDRVIQLALRHADGQSPYTTMLLYEICLLLYPKLSYPSSWFKDTLEVYGIRACDSQEVRLSAIMYVLLRIKGHSFFELLGVYRKLIEEAW